MSVSIHTPVWGVTLERLNNIYNYSVSIHTPVWGVTRLVREQNQLSRVSIHTPVWGVTICPKSNYPPLIGFNPHARVGRDCDIVDAATKVFSFNPHARVGRDIPLRRAQIENIVSIHTPVWGVTSKRFANDKSATVSIHTPVWGVTAKMLKSYNKQRVSIHTPVWGVTVYVFMICVSAH